MDCADNVISRQCGEEIGRTLHELGLRLLAEMNCTNQER